MIGVSVNVPGRGVVLLIVCTAATQHNASCRTYSTCCDIVESVLASTRTADLQFSKCTMLAGQLICCSANGTMLASTQTADLQLSKYTDSGSAAQQIHRQRICSSANIQCWHQHRELICRSANTQSVLASTETADLQLGKYTDSGSASRQMHSAGINTES